MEEKVFFKTIFGDIYETKEILKTLTKHKIYKTWNNEHVAESEIVQFSNDISKLISLEDLVRKTYVFVNDLLQHEFSMYYVTNKDFKIIGMYEDGVNKFYELEEFLKTTVDYLESQLLDDAIDEEDSEQATQIVNEINLYLNNKEENND